jgi:hypothetical protein
MSNMEEGRRAGGSGPRFTAAVIIILLVLLGMAVWRALPAPITSDHPAIARQAD